MELGDIQDILSRVKGCTFASLDAETTPSPGVKRVTVSEQVILFTNKVCSGYEQMVQRRLKEVGKDPASFSVGPLPWGERVPDSPLVTLRGSYYLQTILLKEGAVSAFIGRYEVDPKSVGIKEAFKDSITNQGLPPEKQVIVRTYKLESLRAIRLLGVEILANSPGFEGDI